MKQFHFKFHKLLHLRKSQEEKCLRELSAVQQIQQDEMENRRFLFSELGRSFQRKDEVLNQSLGIEMVRSEQDYITGTNIRIQKANHAILHATRRVNQAFREYFVAKRNTRVLEALHEKQRVSYAKESSRREQKIQDDLTSIRWKKMEEEG